MSLSARRAWIEIRPLRATKNHDTVSLSARRAWIEIADYVQYNYNNNKSLSARRAWIEIANPGNTELTFPGRSPQGERG